MEPNRLSALCALLADDPVRLEALAAVAALTLPDGWIGAGFVRDAVWDHLHGRLRSPPAGDIDVIWFSRTLVDPAIDRDIERRLSAVLPKFAWSVKNQARMHHRNGDRAYKSAADAMMHWPETATAVAARLHAGTVEINAPFGLDDLFGLCLRPTPAFVGERRAIFDGRVASKQWLKRYPMLTIPSLPASP
ncbi:nucleotidyltransferase family protein [Sphingopyxis granuli]|uniref:Nucleotidyltransferase family protein n=1 Tax=Sphingopyxis granuli TaxID=267128 RepID=A0AA86GLW4_9SPHN|nr:nucleotidyltransferase family protein [Sphingopyxis granuli]AMG74506.1 Uncharacterized protein SGRAN_2131 [Sphingopyxis granuli]